MNTPIPPVQMDGSAQRPAVGIAETAQAPPAVAMTGLATASPPHVLEQDAVIAQARAIFGRRGALFAQLEPVYTNARIARRQACQPLDWFRRPADMAEKTALYLQAATDLAEEAARRALTDAGRQAREIDLVVFVSSTGIATPSIDARLAGRLGLRADVARQPVFGFGCAGGVQGLSRAAALLAGGAGQKALVVVLELCTLAFRHDRLTKSNLVATALFGDGAAAMVLETGADATGGGFARLGAAGEHQWPDTLNVMGWAVDAQGFDVIFHRDIPKLVTKRLGPARAAFLTRAGLTEADIARPCCHPGGARVIEALEDSFALAPGALEAERDVLREHGNMSAPTVLFVLDRLRRQGQTGPVLMTALGPGFTAAFQMLTMRGGKEEAQR
ncbi:MAG: type III polyketide synthase [Pararhodobacter sp.]